MGNLKESGTWCGSNNWKSLRDSHICGAFIMENSYFDAHEFRLLSYQSMQLHELTLVMLFSFASSWLSFTALSLEK